MYPHLLPSRQCEALSKSLESSPLFPRQAKVFSSLHGFQIGPFSFPSSRISSSVLLLTSKGEAQRLYLPHVSLPRKFHCPDTKIPLSVHRQSRQIVSLLAFVGCSLIITWFPIRPSRLSYLFLTQSSRQNCHRRRAPGLEFDHIMSKRVDFNAQQLR